jgi:hypothetical protein
MAPDIRGCHETFILPGLRLFPAKPGTAAPGSLLFKERKCGMTNHDLAG